MNPNLEKIDDAVLALLHLTSFTEKVGPVHLTRACSATRSARDELLPSPSII